MEGKKQFSGSRHSQGRGHGAGVRGNLGIMDIYALRDFGRGRRFDRIDIGLQDGLALAQGEPL